MVRMQLAYICDPELTFRDVKRARLEPGSRGEAWSGGGITTPNTAEISYTRAVMESLQATTDGRSRLDLFHHPTWRLRTSTTCTTEVGLIRLEWRSSKKKLDLGTVLSVEFAQRS